LSVRGRPARRRSRRGGRLLRVAVGALLAGIVFLLGIGLGRALEDEPDRRTRTLVRTLKPLELPPARETVTVRVTVTAP
jgi:hypothetical protein